MRRLSTPPKFAGKVIIRQAAEHLMLLKRTTSSTEIKFWLHQQGYLAHQPAISMWMYRLAKELNWKFKAKGGDHHYSYKLDLEYAFRKGIPKFSLN